MKTIFSQEDCQDYVDEIRYCLDYHEADTSIYDALKVLEHIMIDYFDNPPLKFEELEENNWYWDNKDKEWCKYITYSTFEYLDGYGSEFEENRFYRKEVKHD